MRSIDRTRSIARRCLGLTALAILLLGCVETYVPGKTLRPKTERLVIQHTAGGTYYGMELNGQIWYLLFGPELLVVNPESGRIVDQQDLSGAASHGPATAMLLHAGELWIVLEDVAVVRLSLDDPRRPWIEETMSAGSLGIQPRGLAVIEGDVVAFGNGGIVDLERRRVLVETEGDISSVAAASGSPVYCEGRRIHRISDGEYVGSASELHVLHGRSPWGDDAIVFVRHEQTGSLLGLMDEHLREYDAERTTVAVPGHVHQVRFDDERLLVATDQEIRSYIVHDGALQLYDSIPLVGLRDVMRLDDDTLLVAGTFGRGAISTGGALGDSSASFDHYEASPAGLTAAVSDGRNIMATSPAGDWLYRIGHEAVPAEVVSRAYASPASRAVALDWEAAIEEDDRRVRVTTPVGSDVLVAPGGSRFTYVAAADGVLWLGHETGIIMVRLPASPQALPEDWSQLDEQQRAELGLGALDGMTKLSVQLDGPIIFLEPLMLGGGVAYVSRDGGFGVVAEQLQ
ncbi:MAG: hypothetical protein MK095_02220 [Phycisphaerales bacterium]|nr:hypothetical protein [Phycisphaerales bacterium]